MTDPWRESVPASTRRLTLGTRGSLLALTQSRWVAQQLTDLGYEVALEVIRTTGDRISDRVFSPGDGKGVFVAEIEQALLDGVIDLAVHSMKDLPGEMADGLVLGAVPERENPHDVMIGSTLAALPAGATIGTSSMRRRALLHTARPDLNIADLRGNIDTRLRKLDEGQYNAICLAAAGIHRLGLADRVTEYLGLDIMIPPVGQGALAIQMRADDTRVATALAPLNHEATHKAILAERVVLATLGGGCSIPLGVLATVDGDHYTIKAVLCSPDGNTAVREELDIPGTPQAVGAVMATRLLAAAEAANIPLPK